MRVLVLGGTAFVGPALVDAALERGAEVTVLNRGTRAVPDGVEHRTADRTGPALANALADGEWDVVLDTWSGAPSAVTAAVASLAGRVGSYVYVSSCSVYTWPSPAGSDEDTPVVGGDPDATGEAEYPAAKRGGELAAQRHDGPVVLARAGLVLGPRSNVGRLQWWLQRIARGGRVLAPGPPETPVQYVDARDLAGFCLDAGIAGRDGAYNVIGEPGTVTIEDVLSTCVEVTGADVDLCWLSPDTIADAGIAPWTDLPIWLPPGEANDAMCKVDVSRAHAAGLQTRPLAETVADTWSWLQAVGTPELRADLSHGIDEATEARALVLHDRRSGSTT